MQNQAKDGAKKSNGFVSVLKKIFVHNFGWKLLSLFAAALIWALSAGLAL